MSARADVPDAVLAEMHGPLRAIESETSGCLPLDELDAIVAPIWDGIVAAGEAPWTTTPTNILRAASRAPSAP